MGRACLQNGGGHYLPQITLYGEHSTGYCDRGAPKKRFKDSLKRTLGTCHIDHHKWSTLAADHQAWCHTIHQVVSIFENSHRANLKEKHRRRRIQGASTAIPNQTFNCSQLWPDLPVSHWPSQPSACLQSTWTASFINLHLRSLAKKTVKFREGHDSFSWIAPLYPWSIPYNSEC